MDKPLDNTLITIGKLSARTGVNIETIRYYERIRLIPKPFRSEGGNRLYDMERVKRLAFIKRCRELGFPLDTIREFLNLVDKKNYTCAEIADISQHHLEDIRAKVRDLKRIENHMKDMLSQCNKNNTPDCAFIDILFA
jgi:MerR family transcriptional regulator, mercuric resistance operon regulatory protein